MAKKQRLPYEIRQECLWIVRGYDRRRKAYFEARRQIVDGVHGNEVGMPKALGCSRTVEGKAERLAALEAWPETQKMRAVEQAKLHVGVDILNEELRCRLADAIILNCENRHEFPFRYMNLPGISKSDFYRRKDAFLEEIAEQLKMI